MNVTGVPYFKLEVNYDSLKIFLKDLVGLINENKSNLEETGNQINKKQDQTQLLSTLR